MLTTTFAKNFLYSAFAIAISLALGKALQLLVGGLPGSLYGMMFFALMLHLKIFNGSKIKDTIQWIIAHMGICFVPAGVGAMNYLDLLKDQGLIILLMVLATTFLLMTLIALVSQYIFGRQQKNKA
jgi:holin-like protein